VLFEAGTRGKTVFVQVGKVKPFSDVGGRHMPAARRAALFSQWQWIG